MTKRNTKTKQIILESLKKTETAVSGEILQERLAGLVDRATIYRTLNSFCEDGIIHKILADDGKQYFAICINCNGKEHHHNHLHFRCLNCGKVECLQHEIELKLPEGYSAENFNGFVSGYCASCPAV